MMNTPRENRSKRNTNRTNRTDPVSPSASPLISVPSSAADTLRQTWRYFPAKYSPATCRPMTIGSDRTNGGKKTSKSAPWKLRRNAA